MQPVFVGGKIIYGNKLAGVGVEVAQYRQKLTENEVMLAIECLYWDLVSLHEKEKTLNIVEVQLDTLLKNVELAYKTGLTTQNDVLKVKLKQNEISTNRLNLENGIQLIKMAICQQTGLGIASSDSLEIVIPDIDSIKSPFDYSIEHAEALTNRMESKLLEKSVEAAQLQTKIKRADHLPTVAVGALYSKNNLLKNRFSEDWRDNGLVYVTASVPLTGWWGGSHAVKKQKIEEQIARNNKADAEEQLLLQMQNVKNELNNAYRQALLAKEAIEQSTENYRQNNNHYNAGIVNLTDVLDAQTILQQSRDRYVESYGKYERKRIEYMQVTGR
jgi:outer membrane protein TolC